MSSDVAVVGMACVFPGAKDLKSFWRNIVNGVDSIGPIPPDRWPGSPNAGLPPGHPAALACDRGGFIPTPFLFDANRFKVMPNAARTGDVDQFILLHVLADALEDAGIGPEDPRRERTDVIVGRGGYVGNKAVEIFLRADLLIRCREFLAGRFPDLPPAELDSLIEQMQSTIPAPDVDGLTTCIPNLAASRATNRLDLRGTSYAVDAACASSLLSVEHAARRLREGVCDVALACGVNFTHVPSFWYLFTKITALSPTGRIAPFDKRADGMLIGEGAGAVALKRLEDARRDGDRIYAIVRGAGSSSDGSETGILAPSSRGQVQALERAYRDAGVAPDTIGLLEAHGTATAQGDAAELESIKAFYGRRRQRIATRAMGSIKSMIGHTMTAAGIASFIKTVLALSNKILPPSLHCEQPHPGLEDAPFYVNSFTRPWIHSPNGEPRRAGINAFGFGGINAHVVLEEVAPGRSRAAAGPVLRERPIRPDLDRASELLVFGGADPLAVAARVRRAARFLSEDKADFALEDLAFTLAGELQMESPCKLAVIAEHLEGLGETLGDLAGQLERGQAPPGEREGIYYDTDAARCRGRVAGLFPGLGFPGLIGNFPDHLMTFCMHFPAVRRTFDLVETRDGDPDDDLPTSLLLQPPPHLTDDLRAGMRKRFAAGSVDDFSPDAPLNPADRLLSPMGMLTSNWGGWQLVKALGIRFDMLSGQSIGDISAACAAGMVDFETVVPRLWRCLSIDPRFPDLGRMAFVAASEERLAPFLERFESTEIAVHQTPQTVVVAGPDDEIRDLVRALRAENIMARGLPFPPMHSPRMAPLQEEMLRTETEPTPLKEPAIRIYSAISEAPVPEDHDEFRDLLRSNMTRPVRFWQTLRRMHDDGARVFIQAGSGTLAGNVQTVLGDKDLRCVALDVDYRDPITQYQHMCAGLLVSGVPIDLTALFAAREPGRLPLDAPRPAIRTDPQAVPLTMYWPPLPVETGAAVPTRKAREERVEPESAALPFVGRVSLFEPGRRLIHERRVDLEEDLYLADHAFLECRDFKPLRDCFPVVPLTVTLEMMAEAGACLAPGLGLIGFESVRAKKWIALDGVDAIVVRVEAERHPGQDGTATVSVEVFVGETSMASARVRFAARYRTDLDMTFSELTNAHPFPVKPPALYETHFFHGPRFHCIEAIHARGDQGIAGEITVPAYDDFLASTPAPQLLTDPVVLDGVGQMLGAFFFDRIVHIFPVAVDRVEFYRPAPPPGTRVPVRVELLEYDHDRRILSAMMEVQDGQGRVWFRVHGWQDVIFRYSREMFLVHRQPARHTLAREQELAGLPKEGIAAVLPDHILKDVQTDNLARFYLMPGEMESFRTLGRERRRQREWLMGRVAAKDAARLWMARKAGGPMLHPLQLEVREDERGRPVLDAPAGHEAVPAISIAHTGGIAAAVAAAGPVGIDVESAEAGSGLALEDFATAAEIEQVARLQDAPGAAAWRTRLWCGKEAAAKAIGSGLGGRPKSFEAIRIEPDGRLVIRHGDSSRSIRVQTSQSNGTLFAIASLDSSDW